MEAKINNSDEQRKIRKSQITLVIVGTGVIVFGAWAALKVYLLVLFRKAEIIEAFRGIIPEEAGPVSDDVFVYAVLFAATAYVLIELGIRLFVGLSAISEGRGTRSGKMYIFFTVLLIISGLIIVAADTYEIVTSSPVLEFGSFSLSRSDAATSFIVDLTSLVMEVQMVVSAFRIKRFKRKMKKTEAELAA